MAMKISIFSWISIICCLIILEKFSFGQNNSPCPNSLTFDENNNLTSGTWVATIHLYSNTILHGIFIDLIFDRKTQSVGTFFYEVTTKDSIEFHIEDPKVKLKPGETIDIKFYVKYNTTRVPAIKEIRLNGQNICKSSIFKTTTTTTSPLFNLRETEDSTYYESNNNRRNVERRENHFSTTQQTQQTFTKREFSNSNRRRNEESTISDLSFNSFTTENSNNNNNNNNNYYQTSTSTHLLKTTTKNPYFVGDLSYITSSRSETNNFRQEKIHASEICGTIVKKSNPLIVLGKKSYRGQFPWHSSLYISTGSELKYICAGSLITKKIILTAGHCVTHQGTNKPISIDSLLIYLGKYNLRKWSGPEQDVKISEIIIHPRYDSEKFFSDISLIKLKTDAIINDFVRPVCLWNFNTDLRSIINNVGTVPGWGYNENGVINEDLSYIEMPVVSHETCIWSDRDFFSRITSDYSYCAGFKNGSSVCNGDSGGGMIFNENGKWYLRGIVSVSIALQNHFLCDPKHYAVFTDVSKFSTWINENL